MTEREVLYIAGPMRGIAEFNFPAFFEAEDALLEAGYAVFSPARHDVEVMGFDYRNLTGHEDLRSLGFVLADSLAEDLRFICQEADGIALLPGWERSRGVAAEVATAKALDKPAEMLSYWTHNASWFAPLDAGRLSVTGTISMSG